MEAIVQVKRFAFDLNTQCSIHVVDGGLVGRDRTRREEQGGQE